MTRACFIGIDVARPHLDGAVRPDGSGWRVTNDEPSIAALTTRLAGLDPTLVVVEATGRAEAPLVAALAAAGLPIVVVKPRQVRDFAKAIGQLAKTDALDAAVLADFGAAVRPAPRPLPDAATQELRALLGRRRQLVEMPSAEQNRLSGAAPRVPALMTAHRAWLREQQATVEAALATAVQASPAWRARGVAAQRARRRSRPGPDAYCRHARVGHPGPQGDGHLGRGRAPES